jgi:hypothetical protein
VRRRGGEAQVAFARIYSGDDPDQGEQIPLIGVQDALLTSLVPGTTVTRYGRTWHMARYEVEDDFVIGEIGFDAATSPAWVEETKEFLVVRPAQVAPFAIDLERMRVSFRLRGNAIKPGTFQGNFEALLNKAGSSYDFRWTVRLEGVEQPPWEEWTERVDRITEVTATLVRPNPHYDFEEIERMFEGADLSEGTIRGKGDDIKTDGGGIIQAAIEYVLNGYGRLRAKAVKIEAGAAKPETWNSEQERRGVRKRRFPLDPETGELRPEDLKDALHEPTDPNGSV